MRNWGDYEVALRKRGELTLWFSADAIQAWRAPISSKPGGQRIYSDLAIETALTVRAVYSLGLRQTEGFLRSIVGLLALDMHIPDHSRLSRRSRQLRSLALSTTWTREPVHILIDSTGLKVHRGNQCERQAPNRRAWRKLHLAVELVSGEILASTLTSPRVSDATQVPELLERISSHLASLSADGAYDSQQVYEVIETHQSDKPIRVIIPPRRQAVLSAKPATRTCQRDDTIRSILELGRRRWQKASGYTRRSLIEAAISRYKRIIGGRLRSRTLPSQRTEARIGCWVLNRMARLGMLDGYCLV